MIFRLALSVLLTSAVASAVLAQSQDSQSVAEAARRAKEQKKAAVKPGKTFTDDDVKPATPGGAANAPAGAGTASTPAAAGGAQAPAAANGSNGQAAKEGEKESKEVTDLKAQLKQAQSDLDLLQRQLRLDQDALYSKTDYASDKAGLAKIDDEKQQVGNKRQEVDDLKAKLAELLQSLGIDASTQTQSPAPPKP